MAARDERQSSLRLLQPATRHQVSSEPTMETDTGNIIGSFTEDLPQGVQQNCQPSPRCRSLKRRPDDTPRSTNRNFYATLAKQVSGKDSDAAMTSEREGCGFVFALTNQDCSATLRASRACKQLPPATLQCWENTLKMTMNLAWLLLAVSQE